MILPGEEAFIVILILGGHAPVVLIMVRVLVCHQSSCLKKIGMCFKTQTKKVMAVIVAEDSSKKQDLMIQKISKRNNEKFRVFMIEFTKKFKKF